MQIGGAERPYYIGTRQTAIFCELQGESYDLQDYNNLLGQVLGNQVAAAQAQEKNEKHIPVGRKELTAGEVRDFVYSALVAGAGRAELPVDFTPNNVADWIDEADAAEVMKPVVRHIGLLGQRLERQASRPGNVPAPKTIAKGAAKPRKAASLKR